MVAVLARARAGGAAWVAVVGWARSGLWRWRREGLSLRVSLEKTPSLWLAWRAPWGESLDWPSCRLSPDALDALVLRLRAPKAGETRAEAVLVACGLGGELALFSWRAAGIEALNAQLFPFLIAVARGLDLPWVVETLAPPPGADPAVEDQAPHKL